jgi:hypothetical protein
MAPFMSTETNGARNLLRVVIILNLVLALVTLWAVKAFNDAMAKSQIALLEKAAALDDSVQKQFKDFDEAADKRRQAADIRNEQGEKRIKRNGEIADQMGAKVDALIKEDANRHEEAVAERDKFLSDCKAIFQDIADRMQVVIDKSEEAAKASAETHAKVSQKLVTEPEAEAIKRESRQKDRQIIRLQKKQPPAVYKFWPWQ